VQCAQTSRSRKGVRVWGVRVKLGLGLRLGLGVRVRVRVELGLEVRKEL
jgi:hypothetical protein